MTRYPVRFERADDIAIRLELSRHHTVMVRRDEVAGESSVLCSCGEAFGPLPKHDSVIAQWAEHFLTALKGSAA